MVFKIIRVQRIFRIATAVTIQMVECGIEWDIWLIFSHLEGISNVALLLTLIVHIYMKKLLYLQYLLQCKFDKNLLFFLSKKIVKYFDTTQLFRQPSPFKFW